MRSVHLGALLASALLPLPARPGDVPGPAGPGTAGDGSRTVQIATLSASPRRCVTIASVPPSDPDGSDGCDDAPGWHDGTNGCSAYSAVPSFCADYGTVDRRPLADLTANEACCACGGGRAVRPRFRVGEHVSTAGPGGRYAGCLLRVAGVDAGGSYRGTERLPFEYALEVTGKCGPEVWVQDPERGTMGLVPKYGPGHRL